MIMIEDTTVSQLRSHAGLEEFDLGEVPSISACTWLPGGLAGGIAQAAGDVIRLLNRLNRQINGNAPSESTKRDAAIPRTLVFAIQEIIRLMRAAIEQSKDAHTKAEFARQEWRVSTAWYGLLCGDVDDLEQYVAEEEAARSP